MATYGTYNFAQDNKKAREGEDLVVQYIEQIFNLTLVERAEGKFSAWDLKFKDANGGEFTVEVKLDLSCAKTGNIAIETMSIRNGQEVASGVKASTADCIAYLVSRGQGSMALHVGSRSDFDHLIEHRALRTVMGGDGRRTQNVLVRYDNFAAGTELLCEFNDPRFA